MTNRKSELNFSISNILGNNYSLDTKTPEEKMEDILKIMKAKIDKKKRIKDFLLNKCLDYIKMAAIQGYDTYCFDLCNYHENEVEFKEIAEYIKSRIDKKFNVTIVENYKLQIDFPTEL